MPDSPVLVLLHGAVLNGHMWDPIVETLSDFKTVAPDLPGHGSRSSEPFVLSAAVKVVQDLVNSLAPAKVVLCGDSLGSYVAEATAPTLGDQLVGAVLAGGTANFQGIGGPWHVVQGFLAGLIPQDKLIARLEERIVREYAAGPAIIKAGLRPAAFKEAVAEFRTHDFRADIAKLTVPLLFVNGTKDWPHRWGEGRILAAAQKGTLRHIAGAGHGVSLLRPAELAGMIREFVVKC